MIMLDCYVVSITFNPRRTVTAVHHCDSLLEAIDETLADHEDALLDCLNEGTTPSITFRKPTAEDIVAWQKGGAR